MERLDDRSGDMDPGSYRIAAGLWLAGGVTWLVAGAVDGGSVEAIWIVADLLLLAGLLALGRLRPFGDRRLGRAGLTVAVVGRLVFVAAELVSIAQKTDENPLLPVGALLSALGMVALGVAVARGGVWRGPGRFAPLTMGLYPFVVMFPLVAASGGEPSVAAIAVWGLAAVLVGAAAWAQQGSARAVQAANPAMSR